MQESTTAAETSFDKMSPEEALKHLSVNAEKGLNAQEAKERLEKFGPNTLEQKKSLYLKNY